MWAKNLQTEMLTADNTYKQLGLQKVLKIKSS